MKTSNLQQGRAHPEAIIRGWVSPRRAGSTGVTVGDGTTTGSGITNILVQGGTVTVDENGVAVITIGTGGDGTLVPTVNTPITAALSNPPTQAELETSVGSPASEVPGQAYIITDSDSGLGYIVWSTGEAFDFLPTVQTAGGTTALVAGAGIFSDFAAMGFAAAYDATSGKTFWTYLNENGDACVTDGTTEFVLHAALSSGDSHGMPAILIRSSDRKIICFYCAHNDSHMYVRISSAAADISAFGSETDIASSIGTGLEYNYPMPIETTDGIYLFARTESGAAAHAGAIWSYTRSTNNGTSWSTGVQVVKNASFGTYWLPSKTDTDRIDFQVVNRSPFDAAGGSVYHMYLIGTTFHTTDGTAITATKPFDETALTQIWASDGTQRGNPGMTALGSDGKLRVLFREFETVAPDDCRYMWGIYDSVWSAAEIAGSGSGSGSLTPTAVLEPGNPSSVWYSKDDGSSVAQIHRITTPDDGLTWIDRQITDSASEQALLAAVLNAGPYKVIWNSKSGGWTRNATVAADFYGAAFAAVDGSDAQRIVVVDGTGRAEAIIQRTSGGVWQISRDLGGSWESLGGTSTLDSLSDVTITSVASGDALRYIGGVWINANLHDENMIATDGTVMVSGILEPMMHEVAW